MADRKKYVPLVVRLHGADKIGDSEPLESSVYNASSANARRCMVTGKLCPKDCPNSSYEKRGDMLVTDRQKISADVWLDEMIRTGDIVEESLLFERVNPWEIAGFLSAPENRQTGMKRREIAIENAQLTRKHTEDIKRQERTSNGRFSAKHCRQTED